MTTEISQVGCKDVRVSYHGRINGDESAMGSMYYYNGDKPLGGP